MGLTWQNVRTRIYGICSRLFLFTTENEKCAHSPYQKGYKYTFARLNMHDMHQKTVLNLVSKVLGTG